MGGGGRGAYNQGNIDVGYYVSNNTLCKKVQSLILSGNDRIEQLF